MSFTESIATGRAFASAEELPINPNRELLASGTANLEGACDVLRPISAEHPDDETFDGLLILRPEGRLFFVNAQSVADQIKVFVTQYQPKVLVLDLSGVFDIEYSALQMLIEGERFASRTGRNLWLAGLNPDVLEVVRHAGLAEQLGRQRMFFNAGAAIERYLVTTEGRVS